MIVYMIRHKANGQLLSDSNYYYGPRFSDSGRIFTTKGAVKNHLNQMRKHPQRRTYPFKLLEVVTCEVRPISAVDVEHVDAL